MCGSSFFFFPSVVLRHFHFVNASFLTPAQRRGPVFPLFSSHLALTTLALCPFFVDYSLSLFPPLKSPFFFLSSSLSSRKVSLFCSFVCFFFFFSQSSKLALFCFVRWKPSSAPDRFFEDKDGVNQAQQVHFYPSEKKKKTKKKSRIPLTHTHTHAGSLKKSA